MKNIKLSNGKEFKSQPEKTILDSAIQQNIILEYSCRTGRCGVCKSKVTYGETKIIQHEEAISSKERDNNIILTCCRSATSDIILEAEDLSILSQHPPKISPCRIDSLKKLSPSVMEVILRLPPNQSINYLPGQYIDVIGYGGVRRSYSIANAPRSDGKISLFIKKVENGKMSRYWFHEAKVNDLLRLEGPLGTFFFREPAPEKIAMLATGTGIAPIKALLEQMNSSPEILKGQHITLLWGNRVEHDFFWVPTFENLNLLYTQVLSQASKHWRGKRKYVQNVLMDSGIELRDTAVYACGSAEMISCAKDELIHAGVLPENFHSDAFVCSS